mgnify:CR=1 FL=1
MKIKLELFGASRDFSNKDYLEFNIEKNRWDDWRHFIHGRKAARVVQSCWRGFTAYRNYLVLLRWQQYASSCAYIIQSSWRIHVAWQATWGSGGVFVKMNASRLIQSLWRGYIKQKTYPL